MPRLLPRLVAVLLVAVVAGGDSASADQGRWQWWQPWAYPVLMGAAFSNTGGYVLAQPLAATPCGVVDDQRFDPRLLCPADLGGQWSAVDLPVLLLAGCQPYGQIDAAGLTDGTTFMFERIVDKASRAAALATLAGVVKRPGCDLGHGVRWSAPRALTVGSRPALEITEVTAEGSAQATEVVVGNSVVALWSMGTPTSARELLEAAITRMSAPRRHPPFIDVTGTPPFRCLTPATCAALDSDTTG